MQIQEIANRLVELCRMGQHDKAYTELFSQDAVAIESEGAPVRETHGLEALLAKAAGFQEMIEEYHGGSVSDPVIAGNFFSISMTIDVTYKGRGRTNDAEICLYQVKDGKIVKEQFFY